MSEIAMSDIIKQLGMKSMSENRNVRNRMSEIANPGGMSENPMSENRNVRNRMHEIAMSEIACLKSMSEIAMSEIANPGGLQMSPN